MYDQLVQGKRASWSVELESHLNPDLNNDRFTTSPQSESRRSMRALISAFTRLGSIIEHNIMTFIIYIEPWEIGLVEVYPESIEGETSSQFSFTIRVSNDYHVGTTSIEMI